MNIIRSIIDGPSSPQVAEDEEDEEDMEMEVEVEVEVEIGVYVSVSASLSSSITAINGPFAETLPAVGVNSSSSSFG